MNNTLKELKAEVQKLLATIELMASHEGEISRIDSDLLLEKLRHLYDNALQLSDSNFIIQNNDNHNSVDIPIIEDSATANITDDKTIAAVGTVANIANMSDDETSILLADTESEPVYAPEPEPIQEANQGVDQPSMEEIEGRQNDDLFEDVIHVQEPEPEISSKPAAETAPEPEPLPVNQSEPISSPEPEPTLTHEPSPTADSQNESPKTLWEVLQKPQGTTTIGDNMAPQKTISDLLSNKGTETTIGETKIVKEPTIEPTPSAHIDPKVEEAHDTTELAMDSEPVATEPAAQNNPQASLFDYFKRPAETSASRTLADSLGETKKQNLEERISTNKVSDLRTVININDKFRFMNELFHNNMKGYNDFIIRLNALNDRNEALQYVQTISEQYNWDNDSLATKTFFDIFDKKF